MRILLVQPAFPRTYWGFQHALPLTGKRATLPPLGLITVAAALPPAWHCRLVDLNVERLTDEALGWADAVLVGGMLVQAPSAREVIARARALGKRTVVGGPAATTAPELFGDADVVFPGEIEGRLAELEAAITGAARVRVAPREPRPAIAEAPVPRFDLLRLDRYTTMSVQTSRGCPYHCEFCDVIEIFGRVPRVKAPAQVTAELEALRALGWRGSVFVVDDNFIGNIKEARRLLPELQAWQRAHGRPFELYTEASINLASDPELLAAMVDAGFTAAFVGIETPSLDALRGAGKTQNLKVDLREAIATITRAGIEVMGGFIVGFDSDDPSALEAQRAFLAAAPIPTAMVGVLTALPGTALWKRLRKEGRLRERSSGDQFDRPNFAPKMDEVALLEGYAHLLAELYSPDGYLARCRAVLDAGGPVPSAPSLRPGWWKYLARATWALGVKGPRRALYWKLVAAGARRGGAGVSWAVVHAIQGEHLIRYTAEDVVPRVRAAAEEARRAARAPGGAAAAAAGSGAARAVAAPA
jgi:radical SAM superfamily enzyme YgiQ (UPF0313 family)